MEHVKEDRHAEATKRLNERREQHDRGNQIPQYIEKVEYEPPEQKSCYQSGPDQGEQRRIFDCHGRSMSVAGVIRNSGCGNSGTKHVVRSNFAKRGQLFRPGSLVPPQF